jgi:hypothetical protein
VNATITQHATLSRVAAVRTRDRRLAVAIAVFVPLVAFIGFARSYYLKAFFGFPPLPSLLVHIHGVVMTAWVALFSVQVGLVASHRTRLHMKLGILGSALALLVFVLGILTSLAAAARGSAIPGWEPLRFLVIPLGDMLAFGALVGGALYYRRKMEIHKRLMFLSALNLLPAAVARIPLDFIQSNGALAFYGLPDLCVVAVVAYDTIKQGRLHPAYFWGALLLIASHPLRIMLAGTDIWLRLADTLVALVR